MRTAHVVCVVSLDIEPFIVSDGPDARLEKEALALDKATALADAMRVPGAAGELLTSEALNALDAPAPGRPIFVLRDIVPKEAKIVFNSFRHADELEITIPLSLLPIPGSAIRNIVAHAIVRNLTDEEYAAGTLPTASGDNFDFAGVGRKHSIEIVDGDIPLAKLSFVDFAGILGSDKVKAGKVFDEEPSITETIKQFLKGTWAEGIPVKWVDPREAEISVGTYRPQLHKAKKAATAKTAKPKREVPSQYSYLDAITMLCSDVGCVARVLNGEIQVAFAGTMYAGIDRGGETKATVLVGQVVESPLKADHELLGQKFVSIQVISYDPDTHRQYTARWPEDPKKKGASTVDLGGRAVTTPLVANLGRPGFQELDESIIQIPIAPCANPALLGKVAEAIFLERTRQRTTVTFQTHSPWSNPFDDNSPADMLTLRAGDNILFGYVSDSQAPSEVLAITGQLSEGETKALLQLRGVPVKSATEIAAVIAQIPVTDRLRVDEVTITISDSAPANIEMKLVTFTVITSDLEAKSYGISVSDTVTKIADFIAGSAESTLEAIRDFIKQARQDLEDSDSSDFAKDVARGKLNDYERIILSGQ